MPRINDNFLRSIVYIYDSEDAARKGVGEAATGFMLGFNYEYRGKLKPHLYIVTNAHVIEEMRERINAGKAQCIAVRMNRKQGDTYVYSTQFGNWDFHPELDDIALTYFNYDFDVHADLEWRNYVPRNLLVTKDMIREYNIGIGTDVFMIGQFRFHPGRSANKPTVRIGHIALMADESEKVKQHNRIQEHEQESFILNCRSDNGFSGSPVFIEFTSSLDGLNLILSMYVKAIAVRIRKSELRSIGISVAMHHPEMGVKMVSASQEEDKDIEEARNKLVNALQPRLLGVNWGHFPVKQNMGSVVYTDNTDFSCTVPAWKLSELLDKDNLVNERNEMEKQMREEVDRWHEEQGAEVDNSKSKKLQADENEAEGATLDFGVSELSENDEELTPEQFVEILRRASSPKQSPHDK